MLMVVPLVGCCSAMIGILRRSDEKCLPGVTGVPHNRNSISDLRTDPR